MRIKTTLTTEQARKASTRRGDNAFPKGRVTVIEENDLGIFQATLLGDGLSWRLGEETLHVHRAGHDNLKVRREADLYEALGMAAAAISEVVINATAEQAQYEDECVAYATGLQSKEPRHMRIPSASGVKVDWR